MQSPIVSVIVVVYQDCEELSRILNNLAGFRRGGRLEVVVVDGGSNDGTLELLRPNAVDRWISEPDGGIYDAMNKGLALARGQYIIHINAGDTLLAVPWKHLTGDPWVSCQVREDGGIFQPRHHWISYYANTNHHQGSFVRRDVHLGYRTQYRVYADFEHHLRMLCAGIQPTLVYEIVAEHKGGGISSRGYCVHEEAQAVQENRGWLHALVPRAMQRIRKLRG